MMDNRYEYIDEVIARILSGEANDNDKILLDEWKTLSATNVQQFEISRKLFEESKLLKNEIGVDTDKAWLKVQSRIRKTSGEEKVVPFRQNRITFLRIAAMLVLLAGAAAYFILFSEKHPDKLISSGQTVMNEKLPDGSEVTLNKNSMLSYSTEKFGKKRLVRLTGEAFFNVVHDDQNPFVIAASDLLIEDVGTSFNVKAYSNSQLIIVTVATGEVKIFTRDKEGLNLVAGEAAAYDTLAGTFTRLNQADKNVASYRDKTLIFENTELQVIVKLLNDVYTSNILIENDSLKTCRLTATFRNEPLESILDVISETLNLKVAKSQSKIVISGNGCR